MQLTPRQESPRGDAQGPRLKLDRILAVADGSPGPTGWAFDVRVEGNIVFSLRNRNYDDDARSNMYLPLTGERTNSVISVPQGGSARVAVHGRRSFGSDTATGEGVVDDNAGTLEITVKNARTADDGSFVFYFSVAR